MLEEDGICRGYFKRLEIRFIKHFTVTDTIDSNTLDLYADGLLGSWSRLGIVREEEVGDVSEVIHVEVLASGLIDA